MNSKRRRNKASNLFRLDGFRCHYCKRIVTHSTATIDHRIPRSRGGNNCIANMVLSCAPCNNAKGDMTEEEFLDIPYEQREELRYLHSKAV